MITPTFYQMTFSEYYYSARKRFPQLRRFYDTKIDTQVECVDLVCQLLVIYNDIDSKLFHETRKQMVNLMNYQKFSFREEELQGYLLSEG